jgi:hypothetical protein
VARDNKVARRPAGPANVERGPEPPGQARGPPDPALRAPAEADVGRGGRRQLVAQPGPPGLRPRAGRGGGGGGGACKSKSTK